MQNSIMSCAMKKMLLPPRSWVYLEISIKDHLASERPSALHLFFSYITCEALCDFLIFCPSHTFRIISERRKRVAMSFAEWAFH